MTNDCRLDELFKSVFQNIVLFRLIYRYVRLYKKNELVKFEDRNQLIEYPEREFISRLEYNGIELLQVGDLPTSGILKCIELKRKEISTIKSEVIPYGVEKLVYSHYNNKHESEPTAVLSSLPSTIHTIVNVVVNTQQLPTENNTTYNIPPNITSISFHCCPNISESNENGNGFVVIPNSIKSLKFPYGWNNEGISLRKNDIPEGVEHLSITDYPFKDLEKGILPNSIKDLTIAIDSTRSKIYDFESFSDDLFNFLPPNIEILFLIYCNCNITQLSNLYKYTSLTTLEILFKSDKEFKAKIKPNSLPPSLTDLKMIGINNIIENDTIPNSVTNLKLYFNFYLDNFFIDFIPDSVVSLKLNKFINQNSKLPSSLINLELVDEAKWSYTDDDVNELISILPISLTSISLPRLIRKNINTNPLPSTIKKIQYKFK